MKWFRDIGPGVLIAAAFIGPGTVTLCTIAGASFGYSLIWAIVLSIFSTIVLQEMSLRIGLITKMNLAEVIRVNIKSKFINRLFLVLIICSILIGNAAYEAGNITGASLGISAIINSESINYIPIFIGLIAFIILYQGNYKILEKGQQVKFLSEENLGKYMKNDNIHLVVEMNNGKKSFTCYTMDFTNNYININKDYRT